MPNLPEDRTEFPLSDHAASIVKTFEQCNEEPDAWKEVIDGNGLVIGEKYVGEANFDGLKKELQEITEREQLVNAKNLRVLALSNKLLGIRSR
jgi:hypothetical protein